MAQSRPDVQQAPHGLSRHELLEHLRAVSAYLPGFIYQLCLSPKGHFYFTFTSTGLESIFGVTQKRLIEDASLLLKKFIPTIISGSSTKMFNILKQAKPGTMSFECCVAMVVSSG